VCVYEQETAPDQQDGWAGVYVRIRDSFLPPSLLQYLSLLQQVVAVFHLLGVLQVDPVLHGEVSLKLGCLREASADLRRSKPEETTLPGSPALVCV